MAIAAGESYVSHYIHRYRFYDEFPYGLYAFKACGKIPASGRKTFSVHDIRCIWIFCILPASLCTFQDHSSCGCTDSWRLRFFYGGICIPSKKRRASCKNHPGNVPYSICSRRYLPGTGSRKNHDSKNISAFYGRDLRRSLHADVRGKFHPVRKKKHLSGNPEISGKNTAVLRLF